jgi:hypothetical protein
MDVCERKRKKYILEDGDVSEDESSVVSLSYVERRRTYLISSLS